MTMHSTYNDQIQYPENLALIADLANNNTFTFSIRAGVDGNQYVYAYYTFTLQLTRATPKFWYDEPTIVNPLVKDVDEPHVLDLLKEIQEL